MTKIDWQKLYTDPRGAEAALWDEISWLEGFTSDKAQKVIRLYREGRYADALRFYNNNKF